MFWLWIRCGSCSWLLPAPGQTFVSSKLNLNRTVVVSFQQYFSIHHLSSCLLLLLLFQMFLSLHLYRQHQTVYHPMEIKECLLFHQTWLQLWSKRAPSIQLWDHQLLFLRPAHPPARMQTQFKVSREKDLSVKFNMHLLRCQSAFMTSQPWAKFKQRFKAEWGH